MEFRESHPELLILDCLPILAHFFVAVGAWYEVIHHGQQSTNHLPAVFMFRDIP